MYSENESQLAAADEKKFLPVSGVHVNVLGDRRDDFCEKRPRVS